MDWLVTFKKTTPAKAIDQILTGVGCSVPEGDPIPLGDDEVVIRATGPRDLPKRLKQEPGVLKVSPDSTQTLY